MIEHNLVGNGLSKGAVIKDKDLEKKPKNPKNPLFSKTLEYMYDAPRAWSRRGSLGFWVRILDICTNRPAIYFPVTTMQHLLTSTPPYAKITQTYLETDRLSYMTGLFVTITGPLRPNHH